MKSIEYLESKRVFGIKGMVNDQIDFVTVEHAKTALRIDYLENLINELKAEIENKDEPEWYKTKLSENLKELESELENLMRS